MKLRSPWLIRLVGLVGALLIRCWMGTIRYRIVTLDSGVHPADARVRRFVYAFWHETMLFPAGLKARIHVLISQHADGELIAQVCRHLRVGIVRGSSTRGGSQALLELLRCSRRSHLLVTPDGPRGPRRRLQLGLILLASASGLPIVPCGIGYSRAWRARSWDRFAVPHPWSTATCVVAPAIPVPPHLNRDQLEHYRRLVEEQLQSATEAAERWAKGGARPRALPDGEEASCLTAVRITARFSEPPLNGSYARQT
jgi:lysophospholipid acyltransferase (LPLAT)-like uncharacterized protein